MSLRDKRKKIFLGRDFRRSRKPRRGGRPLFLFVVSRTSLRSGEPHAVGMRAGREVGALRSLGSRAHDRGRWCAAARSRTGRMRGGWKVTPSRRRDAPRSIAGWSDRGRSWRSVAAAFGFTRRRLRTRTPLVSWPYSRNEKGSVASGSYPRGSEPRPDRGGIPARRDTRNHAAGTRRAQPSASRLQPRASQSRARRRIAACSSGESRPDSRRSRTFW